MGGPEYETPLTVAKGVDSVRLLVEAGADLVFRNFTADKDPAVVRYLISAGIEVNQLDWRGNGDTILGVLAKGMGSSDCFSKCENAYSEVTQSGKADLHHKNNSGQSIAILAILATYQYRYDSSYYAPLWFLLRAGLDPDTQIDWNGKKTLAQVVGAIHDDRSRYENSTWKSGRTVYLLNALVHFGANPNTTISGSHFIPYLGKLFYVDYVRYDVFKLVKLLISKGADPNGRGFDGGNLLHRIGNGYIGSFNWFKELVALGLDPNQLDSKGQTALYKARGIAINALVNAGANPNFKGPNTLLSPLGEHLAKCEVDSIERFLKVGADGTFKDSRGRNLLSIFLTYLHDPCTPTTLRPHESVSKTVIWAIDSLIQAGSRVDEADKNGMTPLLHLADLKEGRRDSSDDSLIYYTHLDVAQALIDRGADISVYNKNKSSFFHLLFQKVKYFGTKCCIWRPQPELAQLLTLALDKGLDPNLESADFGVLIKATGKGLYAPGSQILFNNGADLPEADGSPVVDPVNTPANACLPNAQNRGWKPDQGGCVSPRGYVWSQFSNTPVSDEEAGDYCKNLSQGGRDDWTLPTYEDYAFAFATHYFNESTHFIPVHNLRFGHSNYMVAAQLGYPEQSHGENRRESRAICVAK